MKILHISQIIILLVVLLAPGGASGTAGTAGKINTVSLEPGLVNRSGETSLAPRFAPQWAVQPQDFQGIDFISHLGGAVNAVSVVGNYVYFGEGGSLIILDVSSPESPVMIGKTHLLPEVVHDIAVAGGYAYLVDEEGDLWVINVSDPLAPFQVGYYNPPGFAVQVAVSSNFVYLTDRLGLRVIDISYPANPIEVGYFDTPGPSMGIAVEGDYAYVTDSEVYLGDWEGGLWVINISDPMHLFAAGSYSIPLGPSGSGVAVAGGYAYVTGGSLRVINVSDPANPSQVGSIDTQGGTRFVAVAGNYAYVVDWANHDEGWEGGLLVIDVSTPTQPVEVGSYEMAYIADIAVTGEYVYLADSGNGLQAIDVSDPTNISLLDYSSRFYCTGARTLVISGDYAYLLKGWGLLVVNVSDPRNPVCAGYNELPSYAYDVAVMGDYAYVANGEMGLRVIDVSDAENPREVSHHLTDYYVVDVAVAGNYAYITGMGGFWVFDISDPTNPDEISFYDNWGGNVIAIAGDYAYVVGGSSLHVIDISDPAYPTGIGAYYIGEYINDLTVAGNYAYVAVATGEKDIFYSLRVIDISDPTEPVEIGFYDTSGGVGLDVDGGYVYLADREDGLLVLDVSDPTNPLGVGIYKTSGNALDVAVVGSFALVTASEGGLYILKYTGVLDATSTTILRDQPDPSIVDGPFTVRVEVYAGFGIPGGEVNVTVEGESASCSAALVGRIASCPITLEATGTYTLTASYAGDEYFLPSTSAPITHTIVLPTLHYLPLVGGE